MRWSEQVFRYCERGLDPAFWAEPLNAASNLAFLGVADVMLVRVRNLGPAVPASRRRALTLMAGLVAMVGAGSFLFHTFATRWALTADVLPIFLFMVVYLAFALQVLLGLGRAATTAIIGAFMAATIAASSIACPTLLAGIARGVAEPCLRGTVGYVPALLALAVTGSLLRQRHPAAPRLLAAAGVFLAAMLLRWLDRDLCAATQVLGAVRGTHALWHLLNAVTLYVLLTVAIEAAVQPDVRRNVAD